MRDQAGGVAPSGLEPGLAFLVELNVGDRIRRACDTFEQQSAEADRLLGRDKIEQAGRDACRCGLVEQQHVSVLLDRARPVSTASPDPV